MTPSSPNPLRSFSAAMPPNTLTIKKKAAAKKQTTRRVKSQNPANTRSAMLADLLRRDAK